LSCVGPAATGGTPNCSKMMMMIIITITIIIIIIIIILTP
jgi:hypothetical protein